MTTVSAVANAATTSEIAQAEAYRTAIIFSNPPGGNSVPPWLANLTANVQQKVNLTEQNTANLADLTAQVGQIANDVGFFATKDY